MKILVVEPFYTDSHKAWLDGFMKFSSHEVQSLTLKGHHWKWRMHGGAVTLAQQFKALVFKPDIILCSDMLDVSTFISLLRKEVKGIPIAMYFHENQLTYPWSPADQDVELERDRHYGFINYTSALAADRLFFNSEYHRSSFVKALTPFLGAFPDHQNLETIKQIEQKADVLPLGLDLRKFDPFLKKKAREQDNVPTLLWNHRWEYDKNPDLFFETLFKLKAEGFAFELIVLGKQYPQTPTIFEETRLKLGSEIIHWGYVEDFEDYAKWLVKADILPVTSIQDFFGISVVEAMYCGALPLLPRKLAYPEHLSGEQFFYEDEGKFMERLRETLLNFDRMVFFDGSPLLRYDWSNQIMKYDAMFTKLCSNFEA